MFNLISHFRCTDLNSCTFKFVSEIYDFINKQSKMSSREMEAGVSEVQDGAYFEEDFDDDFGEDFEDDDDDYVPLVHKSSSEDSIIG